MIRSFVDLAPLYSFPFKFCKFTPPRTAKEIFPLSALWAIAKEAVSIKITIKENSLVFILNSFMIQIIDLISCCFFSFSLHFFICSDQELNPAVLGATICCIIGIFWYSFAKTFNGKSAAINALTDQITRH